MTAHRTGTINYQYRNTMVARGVPEPFLDDIAAARSRPGRP